GFTCLPALLQIVLCTFLPESPRLLIMRGQNEKAELVLKYLRGLEDVDAEISTINTA
ncbi:unnamed protein product, partial [Discosporangium mesarthrocarpum]